MKKIALYLMLITSIIASDDFVTADEAMMVSSSKSNNTIVVDIKLQKHIYIYEDKLKFTLLETNTPLNVKTPKPTRHKTDYSDDMVFDKNFSVNIPIDMILKLTNSANIKLKVDYQGCSSSGFCYQPQTKIFEHNLASKQIAQKKDIDDIDINLDLGEDDILSILNNSSFVTVLVVFFVLGLLLSLTPCVYPMIPILSSIIVSKSKSDTKMSTKKGLTLSVIYVLSMSVAYTIAGILAGAFGANLQTALQNPYVIVAFSSIFVVLAISMFGYFELAIPASWQTKLNNITSKDGKNGVLDIVIMGFLSALIVGPCIAPPLAGALIYISQSGDLILGGASLFVLSLGMGVPLLIVGAGAGELIPRAGGWMEIVNKVFGVVMLGIAVWMLSRILPDDITMLLWSALTISSAVYMGVFESIKDGASGLSKLMKSFSIITLIYGVMLFVGGVTGADDIAKPLDRLLLKEMTTGTTQTGSSVVKRKLKFTDVQNMAHLEEMLKNGGNVMIDFYATWCGNCNIYNKKIFTDTKVISALNGFKLYKIDFDIVKDDWKPLLKKYNAFQPPVMIFYKDGKELKSAKIVGLFGVDKFAKHINKFYK
jgi:thiol:disulfide interchange protein DsbD